MAQTAFSLSYAPRASETNPDAQIYMRIADGESLRPPWPAGRTLICHTGPSRWNNKTNRPGV